MIRSQAFAFGMSKMADASGSSPTTKTKICRFFKSKKGCKLGNECQFLHTEKLLNDSLKISQEAYQISDDKKQADAANISKTSSPVKTCRFFMSKRGCKFGNECQFLHAEKVSNESGSTANEVNKPNDDQKTSDPAIADDDFHVKSTTPNNINETLVEEKGMKGHKDSQNRGGTVCKFFKRKKGGCLRGNKCPFVHVISCDGAILKPPTKETSKKPGTCKAALPSKQIPHQSKEVTKSNTDNKKVTKQPRESVNLESTNQNTDYGRQVSGQGPPLLPKKADESVKGTSTEMSVENCNLECKRLRSVDIQQLKRRFRSHDGYCEIQENVSYKFKFKPTDPDWVRDTGINDCMLNCQSS